MRILILTFLLSLGAIALAQGPVSLTKENESVWRFEGPAEWETKDKSLLIVKNTITSDPYRVPSARAIYLPKKYKNVEVRATVKCNAYPEQIRGDIIIIFGYQSPEQFYYAHFTGTVDDTHNGVFIVNKADRKKLADTNQVPFLPDREWHKIKLVRNVKTGDIEMYVDDMGSPAVVVNDKTFLKGRVGLGSFNDPGEIKDLTINP